MPFFGGFWLCQTIFSDHECSTISVKNLKNVEKYKDENKKHPTIQS